MFLAYRIFNIRCDAVRTRFFWDKATRGRFQRRGFSAGRYGLPFFNKVRQIGIARTFDSRSFCDLAFDLYRNRRLTNRLALFVDNNELDFSRFIFLIQPGCILKSDKTIDADVGRACTCRDKFSSVVLHRAFDNLKIHIRQAKEGCETC